MEFIKKLGSTSVVMRLMLRNSSTGQGLTGLTFSSSGLIISTIADVEASATSYTVAGSTIETITTLGTYAAPTATKCRFKEVDATNQPGLYELQLADARWAVSSAKSLRISVSAATNLLGKHVCYQLVAFDPDDVVRLGLTSIPNVAQGNSGALPTGDASGRVTVIALAAAAVANIWDALTSGFATVGSVGKRLVDYLTGDAYARLGAPANASVSADIATVASYIDTEVAAIKAKTDNLPASPANEATLTTMSTTLATIASYIDTEVAAIKAKTDNLPPDPADASDIAASFTSLSATLATIASYIDTEVAAIKAKTDNLPSSPAAVGSAMTLADGAITAEKIGADAITAAKVAPDVSAEIADAVWDEATSGHQTAGTTGKALTDAGSGGGGGGGSTSLILLRGLTLQIDTDAPGEALRLMQGSELDLIATLLDGSGDPIPTTGFTLTAEIRNAAGSVVVSPSVAVLHEDTGTITLPISSAFTATIQRDLTLTVKLDGGTGNVHVTYPTPVEVLSR